MKLAIILVAPIALTAAVAPLPWTPPGPDDFRGPCPMLNTLANHGILPHSGKNFTRDVIIQGLEEGVNFTPSLGIFLFDFALATNPDPNATSFDLHQLGRHGILEHDASLSRWDKFINSSDAFSEEMFEETISYWKGDTVDLHEAAISRQARAKTSIETNPAFTFSEIARGFAHGEVAAIPLVFGDRVAGTFPKRLVTNFFETERLPTQLGWVKPAVPISNLDLCQMTQRVLNASGTTLEGAQEILPCIDFNA